MHDAKPGQFAMVWVPGVDEVPMSVLAIHGRAEAGAVIKKGGPVSLALWEKKAGDKFWVRGPYGRPFRVGHHHKLLVVGGGTGLVPLISLLVHLRGREVTLITGARTASELLFKDWLEKECKTHGFKVIFATDDGTFGEKNQEETIFYARKDKKFYAARQGEPSVYELSPNEPDNLEAKLKELTEPPVPEPPPAPSNPAPAK